MPKRETKTTPPAPGQRSWFFDPKKRRTRHDLINALRVLPQVKILLKALDDLRDHPDARVHIDGCNVTLHVSIPVLREEFGEWIPSKMRAGKATAVSENTVRKHIDLALATPYLILEDASLHAPHTYTVRWDRIQDPDGDFDDDDPPRTSTRPSKRTSTRTSTSPSTEGLQSHEIEALDTMYPRTRISGSSSGTGSGNYQSISQEPEQDPEPVMADDLDLDCDDRLHWHRGPNWPRPSDGKQNWPFLSRLKRLIWPWGEQAPCLPLYNPEAVERIFRFCVREGAVSPEDRLAFFAEAACDHRSAKKRPGGLLKESIWSNKRDALQCDLAFARQMVWELDSGELERRKAQREHERVVAIELRILATEDDPRTHTDQWLWRMRSQERKDAERLAAAEQKAEEARQAAEAERQKLEERRLRERALDHIRNATDEQIVEWLGEETLFIRQFRKNGRKSLELLQDFLVPIVTDQLKGIHEATDSVFETPDAPPEASIVGHDDEDYAQACNPAGTGHGAD